MIKKILALILAGTMAVLACACSGAGDDNNSSNGGTSETTGETSAPEETEPEEQEPAVGAMQEEFIEDTEQGPEWYYIYDNGNGWQELILAGTMVEDDPEAGYEEYGDNWRLPYAEGDGTGNYSSLMFWDSVMIDIAEGCGTVLGVAWQAPSDGTAVIPSWAHAMKKNSNDTLYDLVNDPDVTVRILHNDEELYSYVGKDSSAASEELTVEVKAGDRIYFVGEAGANTTETLIDFGTVSVDFTAA